MSIPHSGTTRAVSWGNSFYNVETFMFGNMKQNCGLSDQQNTTKRFSGVVAHLWNMMYLYILQTRKPSGAVKCRKDDR